MGKFLVAVDDDEVSAHAFTWAANHLFKPGDSVLLLTATYSDATLPSADITAGEYAIPVAVEDKVASITEASSRASAVIEKFMKQCEQGGFQSEGRVVDGSPGVHIVAEAEQAKVDAVVLGSHGRNVLGRTLLGSISDYVRHHLNLPVVVVRFSKETEGAGLAPRTKWSEERKVVAAVDDSPQSAHAFSWALSNFIRDNDRLTLLHVQNPVAQPNAIGTDQLGMEDVYVPPDTTGRASVEALHASEKMVEGFMKQAAERTKAHCEGRVVTGATQDKLLHELSSQKADVVILGSHAYDVVQRTFLGSVGDFVAHNSPCPIIFVKLPLKDEDATTAAALGGKAHDV